MKILIDTNIILDVFAEREPFLTNSAKVLTLCENNKVDGFITANTVTDIYYILRKRYRNRQLLDETVKKLLTIVGVTDVLVSDINNAFDLEITDFEDALLTQCAIRTHANYIVTRNVKDFDGSPVKAILPNDFLAIRGKNQEGKNNDR